MGCGILADRGPFRGEEGGGFVYGMKCTEV